MGAGSEGQQVCALESVSTPTCCESGLEQAESNSNGRWSIIRMCGSRVMRFKGSWSVSITARSSAADVPS